MMENAQEYFVHYNIASKTQCMVENGEVIKEVKFEVCPYIWFGELKEKIETGLVTWVMWRKHRFINN